MCNSRVYRLFVPKSNGGAYAWLWCLLSHSVKIAVVSMRFQSLMYTSLLYGRATTKVFQSYQYRRRYQKWTDCVSAFRRVWLPWRRRLSPLQVKSQSFKCIHMSDSLRRDVRSSVDNTVTRHATNNQLTPYCHPSMLRSWASTGTPPCPTLHSDPTY